MASTFTCTRSHDIFRFFDAFLILLT
jgi:hypothetical protein